MARSRFQEKGIRVFPNGRIVAYVQVGAAQRFKRFAPETPLKLVRRWRTETRVSLETASATPGRFTFAADVARYLPSLADRPRLQQSRGHELAWWVARFGHRRRYALTTFEITTALAELRASGRAASTVRHYRMALLALYTALDGRRSPNPVRDVPAPSEPKPEPRAVDYRLIRAVLDALSPQGHAAKDADRGESKARLRLHVLAYTGLRSSELKRVRPEDWNRLTQTLYVRTGKEGQERVLPLLPDAIAALEAFDREGCYGGFSNSTLARAWKRACAAAGVTGVRVYDLRHSFGTLLYQVTGDTRLVADALGHRSKKTTERYTLGAVPEYLRVAAARMDQALNGPPETAAPTFSVIQGGRRSS